MNKEKAIKAVDVSIEKMKEGAGPFRRQINLDLITALKGEQGLIDKALEIRGIYNASMRETRVLLMELKNKIENPGPEPLPIPPLPRNKFLDFDALGIFLDILEHGYDSPTQEEECFQRIEQVIAKAANYFKRVSFFTCLGDGKPEHKNLEGKMPWVINKKGKAEFDIPNAHVRHLYNRFLQLLAKYYMEAIPQGDMEKYTTDFYWHSNNNANGIKNFVDPDALEYQQWWNYALVSDQVELGMNPNLKPWNESNHLRYSRYGFARKEEMGHFIADYHKAIWHVVRDLMKMTDFEIDVSCSEWAANQLVEHGRDERICKHCGKAWDNIPGHNRKVKRARHGISITDDLHRKYVNHTVFCNNLKNWQEKYSEDGSKFGKVKPIPSLDWRCGDPEEVKDMLTVTWKMCEEGTAKTGKPNEITWGLHPKTCLKKIDGVFHDIYDVDAMAFEWERAEAAATVHDEFHGNS